MRVIPKDIIGRNGKLYKPFKLIDGKYKILGPDAEAFRYYNEFVTDFATFKSHAGNAAEQQEFVNYFVSGRLPAYKNSRFVGPNLRSHQRPDWVAFALAGNEKIADAASRTARRSEIVSNINKWVADGDLTPRQRDLIYQLEQDYLLHHDVFAPGSTDVQMESLIDALEKIMPKTEELLGLVKK
ncbi:MAG: hypothetical protein GOV15_04675 [Candidatus Diapherotrites archaeon]|nr:hypothetical protein [Candidatus Diapherotrites archaeon]